MPDKTRCPDCGAVIPAGAPAGQCPKCMLKAGFESEGPGVSGFEPPSIRQLSELFPQLEILELVGKGGMGAVYKARQPNLDRFVAVKVLPPDVGRDPAFVDRFTREARALAKLTHPHIVGLHDFGETEGFFYFVMEYVDGVNLRQALQAGNLKPQEALAIVPQICDALQFAHDEGIVHRDIKPENVLIDTRGRVKIADFGLAKLLGDEHLDGALTHTNQVMGTLRYMAPEQMQDTHDVDHRADIYSLGVVFYELLTGDVPMGRFDPPSRKVQIDVRLDDVVLRALAQEPDKRYQHASQVKTDVELLTAGPAPAQPAQPNRFPHESRGRVERKPGLDDTQVADLDLEAARHEVQVPAGGLIAVGILTCVTAIMPLFLALKTAHDVYDSRITLETEASVAGSFRHGALFVLVVLLPSLGIIITWGGWMMMHLRSRGLATTASILAMLPCQPVFILGPIFGIWSLVVLNRPHVEAAFKAMKGLPFKLPEEPAEKSVEQSSYIGMGVALGIGLGTAIGAAMDNIGMGIAVGITLGAAIGAALSSTQPADTGDSGFPHAEPDPEFQSLVRSRLKVPAIGLLVAGIFNLVAAVVVLLIPVFVQRWGGFDEGSGFVEGASTFGEAMFVSISIALSSLALGILLLLGAARMFDLQSHQIALSAAVAAVLPVAIGFPISLPLGIWALLVLSRQDVKGAFGGRQVK